MHARMGLLALVLLLSGCLSGDGPASTAATGSPVASRPALDVARIEGVVVDEEGRPIAGATVGIVESNRETETTQDGTFTFDDVPAGKATVVANRLGFEAGARAVEATPGETTHVRLILLAVAIETAYARVDRHTAFHNFGNRFFDTLVQNQLGWNNSLCQSCQWHVVEPRIPNGVVWEVVGTHSISKPTGPPLEWVDLRDIESTVIVWGGSYALPIRLEADDEGLADKKGWEVTLICGDGWVCYQERRDSYLTFFHHGGPTPGYTALPRP